MKKKIIACVLALGIAVSASGCKFSNTKSAPSDSTLDSRFTIISESDYWIIFYDTKTMIIYLMSYGDYTSGMTPLLDSEGNIQFYKESDSF